MAITRLHLFWTLITVLLLVTIIAGGILVWPQFSRQPVEISISSPPHREQPISIYIGGAVNNPGIYPLKSDDSIGTLIAAAGGTTTSADPSRLKLIVPTIGEEEQPQKININRAEVWLLEALPGIGEVRSKAIIDYRQQQGPFDNINELTKVEGIGIATYEKIKDLITVAD